MFKKSSSAQPMNSNISRGFTVVVVSFLVPILVLFFFMLKFKGDSLAFSEKEYQGVLDLKKTVHQLIQRYRNDSKEFVQHAQFEEKVIDLIDLADRSTLILDSDLDSYYVIYVSVRTIPFMLMRMLQLMNSENSQEFQSKNSNRVFLNSVLQFHLADYSRSIDAAISNDLKYYGLTEIFQNQIKNKNKIFSNTVIEFLKIKDLKSEFDLNPIFEHWEYLVECLEVMIQQRIAIIQYEKKPCGFIYCFNNAIFNFIYFASFK